MATVPGARIFLSLFGIILLEWESLKLIFEAFPRVSPIEVASLNSLSRRPDDTPGA